MDRPQGAARPIPVGQTEILQTLIDISRIITTSHDLEDTLGQTVALIAKRMSVDVCSLYIYNEGTKLLELKATQGLSPSAVGQVRMSPSEGMIGLVLERQSPINLRDVSKHPRYKYFPSIDEERLSSFLGVPLIEYRRPLGVLAIQNQENRLFSPEEENLLVTIASQISGLVSKALLVDRIQREAEAIRTPARPGGSFQVQGIPLASGLAKDKLVILARKGPEEPPRAPAGSPEEEEAALQRALSASELEILELIKELSTRVGETEAAIFHAHLLFLEDRTFLFRVRETIGQGASAAWSVWQVVREFLNAFQSIDDPYLKERGADLQDVGMRLLNHLGFQQRDRESLTRPGILVAEMLSPSDTAWLDPKQIKGIVTAVGGYVSHAAILARSLRIPAVSGVENLLSLVSDGEEALLDGQTGRLFVNPPEHITKEYHRYQQTRLEYLSHLNELKDVPCVTRCGTRVHLRASVGLTQDLEDYAASGAEGIGLFRTEVFYLMRPSRPTEAELVEFYTRALEVAGNEPVMFRTLDIGGDRFPSYLDFPKEENPFLGLRSLRFQLRRQPLLKEQLRALLRVSHLGQARIVFPMITLLDELQEAKRILNVCREELERETGRPMELPPVGMMFEVPAAVLRSELFMGEIDFLTVGSNDLTQYVLAVDRNNPHVNHLYDPLDPAVLMLIKRLVEAARHAHKPIVMCGEVASDPEGCLVLVGLGVRELAMNPPLVPIVKDRLAQYSVLELEQLAQIALSCTSAGDVRRNLQLRAQS